MVGARPQKWRFSNTEGDGRKADRQQEPETPQWGHDASLLTGRTEQQDTMGLVEKQTAEALGWFSNAFLENTQEKKIFPTHVCKGFCSDVAHITEAV